MIREILISLKSPEFQFDTQMSRNNDVIIVLKCLGAQGITVKSSQN